MREQFEITIERRHGEAYRWYWSVHLENENWLTEFGRASEYKESDGWSTKLGAKYGAHRAIRKYARGQRIAAANNKQKTYVVKRSVG